MGAIDPLIYKAKYPFLIESDGFDIKIASTVDDIIKAQQLRHQVFLEEGLGQSHETGLDFDDYDKIADHLMIIEKSTGKAVGTYRLINTQFSSQFYSQGEFHLDHFLNIEGIKLEMGRACTHADFRNGRTMDLLWQGLSKYIQISNTRYLFGCSSVNTQDAQYMFSVMKSLQKDERLKLDYGIHPIESFDWPDSRGLFTKAEPLPGYTKELPPLLRSYLNAGSFVYGMPAYDKDFLCFDLLTILDLRTLNKKFAARYGPFTG
jgi:putative hemolysin